MTPLDSIEWQKVLARANRLASGLEVTLQRPYQQYQVERGIARRHHPEVDFGPFIDWLTHTRSDLTAQRVKVACDLAFINSACSLANKMEAEINAHVPYADREHVGDGTRVLSLTESNNIYDALIKASLAGDLLPTPRDVFMPETVFDWNESALTDDALREFLVKYWEYGPRLAAWWTNCEREEASSREAWDQGLATLYRTLCGTIEHVTPPVVTLGAPPPLPEVSVGEGYKAISLTAVQGGDQVRVLDGRDGYPVLKAGEWLTVHKANAKYLDLVGYGCGWRRSRFDAARRWSASVTPVEVAPVAPVAVRGDPREAPGIIVNGRCERNLAND